MGKRPGTYQGPQRIQVRLLVLTAARANRVPAIGCLLLTSPLVTTTTITTASVTPTAVTSTAALAVVAPTAGLAACKLAGSLLLHVFVNLHRTAKKSVALSEQKVNAYSTHTSSLAQAPNMPKRKKEHTTPVIPSELSNIKKNPLL